MCACAWAKALREKVALAQCPMVVRDVRKCDFFAKQVDQLTGFVTKSIVCVPLIFGGKTLGVIEVVNPGA